MCKNKQEGENLMKKKKTQRKIAWILSALLISGLFPSNVFAMETDMTEGTNLESEQVESADEDIQNEAEITENTGKKEEQENVNDPATEENEATNERETTDEAIAEETEEAEDTNTIFSYEEHMPSLLASNMNVSQNGINLIKNFEGLRTTAYKALSTEKYFTIGYGHYGADVYEGMTITETEAENLLRTDLIKYVGYVNTFLGKYNISINQNQFDALTSFTYNVGNVWLNQEFSLKRYLINGVNNYSADQITTAFRNWNKSGGNVIAGLTRRREAEAKLFMEGGSFDGGGSSSAEGANHTSNNSYSGFVPFKAYANNTGKISVYNAGGTQYSNRYISGSSDLCTINEVYTDGWCKVTYPSSAEASGYFTAYAKLSEFIPNASPSVATATSGGTAYRRSSGSDSIGSISSGDRCLKVSGANGRIQAIYPVNGQSYSKAGWVEESVFGGSNPGGSVSSGAYKVPCKAYAISGGKVTVYNASHAAYAISSHYIDGANDLCTINSIGTDGWCQVSYPTSSGSFTAYVPLSTFIPGSTSPQSWTAGAKYTAYRRSSGSDTIGSVSSGDTCIKVASENGRTQVMYPVTGQNYYKMGWIDGDTGHNPIGAIDSLNGGIYSVSLRGWAFDEDNTGAALGIHVYIGDTCVGTGTADRSRTDVNNVYGCGNYHGYEITLDLDRKYAGEQTVRVYAINVGGGVNAFLGERKVTIGADTEAPVISDCKVSNVTSSGYTVSCKVTDNTGVDRVQFPTWTPYNGQDDIFAAWETNPGASGQKNGDVYTYQVKTSAHNYEPGEYITHIYAYDRYGNASSASVSAIVPVDVEEIELDEENLTFEAAGEEQTLKAAVYPDNATDKTVTWSSGNTAVATVKDGVVKAVGAGETTITATTGNGKRAECKVIVKEKIQQGNCGTNVTWSLNREGVLTISGNGAMKNYTYKSEMPWYKYNSQIQAVNIESGVTSIGNYAFYGMPVLKQVTIPDGVKMVGAYAFKNCTVLKNVQLPTGLKKLGESAFYGCSTLERIAVPEGIYTIWAYTFKNCTSLTEVTLPSTLIKLDEAAFYGCASLEEIDIPDQVSIIGMYSFKNCSRLHTVSLPSALTSVREAAFYGTALTDVELPKQVQSIGAYAFKNCTGLKNVYMPDGLQKIGESAFYGCSGLKTLELPDSVTVISDYAFRKCTGLQGVQFSANLKTIGECAFYGCTGLTELQLPDTVTDMRSYAFKNCTSVGNIHIPTGIDTLKESVFYGCTGIKSIEIPANVKRIENYAFAGCSGLKEIHFTGNRPEIGGTAFARVNAKADYPAGDSTWNQDAMKNYGGQLNWILM